MNNETVHETAVFQPDPELLNAIGYHIQTGRVLTGLEITVRDVHNGETHTLLVDQSGTSAWEMVTTIALMLSGQDSSPLEVFFWLYWRGWAGVFPPDLLY